MSSSPWFVELQSGTKAGPRLLLFHHAGAAASAFRPWLRLLPPELSVLAFQLPGRETRSHERLVSSVDQVVPDALATLQALLDRPTLCFGHSVGAVLAFELARGLRRLGARLPDHLILSGRRAPQAPATTRDLHRMPEAELIASLRRYGGTPEAILRERELMAAFLPRMRADLAIGETYRYASEPALPCPITALAGSLDHVAPPDSARGWKQHTSARFVLHTLEGGHFFIQTELPAVIAIVQRALQALRAQPLQEGRLP